MTRLLLALAAMVALAVPAGATARPAADGSIVQTASAAGSFKTLLALATRAGLADDLASPGPLTVFAPTDAAFQDLYQALGVDGVDEISVATLRAVLLHHVAPGERFSGDVLDSTRIRTLNRDFVYPSVQGGSASISGATILIADVDASNGVIHVIDSVLVPGS